MQIINSLEELELEKKFSKVRASFSKKFFVTFLDLFFVIVFNLPLFIIFAYWDMELKVSSIVRAFKGLINPDNKIEAWRLTSFSAWIFFFCYIYFVLIPSKTKFQTLFSNNLGIKAVNIKGGKIKQWRMFKANFIPVMLLPLINIIFFGIAAIIEGKSGAGEWRKLLMSSNSKVSSPLGDDQLSWIKAAFKALFTIMFFLQVYHLITVSTSKKTLNWFVKSNGIVYVDSEKYDLMVLSEGKPIPVKEKIYVNMPGVETMEYETIRGGDKESSVEVTQENVPIN